MDAKYFRCIYDGVSPHFDQSGNQSDPRYHAATRKWSLYAITFAFSATFVINAPFGRFVPSGESVLLFDGE